MSLRRAAFAVILIFTLATRFAGLGDRLFHHDESVHAWMASEFVRGHGYHYDPVYHGPLLYHLEAAVFFVFGEGEAQARSVQAAFGVALVALAFLFLRRSFGEPTALVASALIAVSPTMTYYSRFNSHDILIAVFTVALMWMPFEYARTGDRRWLMWFAAVGALAVGTKLNAYFVMASLAAFAALALTVRAYQGRPVNVSAWLGPRARDLATAAALAASVLALLFASTLLNQLRASGQPVVAAVVTTVRQALWGGFEHWISIHNAPRLPGPFYYYLPISVIYEPFVVMASASAVVAIAVRRWRVDRRPELACWTLAAVVQTVLYGVAGEKVPWLTMHVVLPWMVVSAAFVVDLWTRRPATRVPLGVVAALCLGVTLHASWVVNTRHANDPVEPLLQLVFSDDVRDAAREAVALASSGDEPTVAMIESSVTWPFGWYLRDSRAGYPASLAPDETAPLLLGADDGQPREGLANRYDVGQRVYLRWSSWLDQVKQGDIAGLLRFAVMHDAWGTEQRSTFRLWRRRADAAPARPSAPAGQPR